MTLSGKVEQPVIMPILTLYYGVLAYLFIQKVGMDMQITKVMLAIASSIFVGSVLHYLHRVSLYALVLGTFLGTFLGLQWLMVELDLLWPFLMLMVVGGVLLTARLSLQDAPSETYLGLLIGLLTALLLLLFLG